MKKRILSFLLMLVMVVSMVPAMATVTAAAEGEEAITADDLYVTEGLVAWWDAFDAANNETVDIANGKWYSRVGDATASLMGGKWAVQKGGLGYALTKAGWDADGSGSNYLDMGIANLPEESYTVDMVATFTGLTNEDGTRYVDGAHKWGVYSGGYAALELENWKFTAFVCNSSTSTAGSGQSALRPSYHNGYWGSDNGKYWIGSDFNFRAAKYADTPASLVIRSTVDSYSRNATSRWDAASGGNHITGSRPVTTKGSSLKVNFDLGAQVNTNTVQVEIASNYMRPFVDEADGKTYYERHYAPSECFLARDTNDKFLLMRNLPGTVYAVRVYNRELTSEEMSRNHFADLVKYIGADLSAFSLMDEETKKTVFTLCANLDFTTSKETLQSKIDEVGNLVKMVDEATTVYDKLYVQDGLVMLLDAFGENNPTVVLATGTWYNLASLSRPGSVFSGSGTAWKYRAGSGIGYDLTVSQHTTNGQGGGSFVDLINAGVDFSGNFTVEYAAEVMILSNDGVRNPEAESMNKYNTNYVNERFGAWGVWLVSSKSFRPIYNNTGRDGHYGHGAGCYGWNGPNMFLADSCATTYSNVITFNSEASTRTFYAGGAVRASWSTGVKDVQSNVVKPLPNVQMLYICRNLATTLYNVRVYDRTLSVEEIKWNGFVDMCAYFGLDVSTIVDVKDLVMNILPSACSFLTFGADEATVARAQATINEAAEIAANVKAAQESATEYDALYVQDGMTVLLSAYDAADAVSVDIAHGLWINKVDTTYATLLDGGNAEKYGWKVGENGGIYYRIPTNNEFVSVKNNTGMALPSDAITDGDFTVEFVFDPLGISGEDGVVEPHTGAAPQSQWGAYNSNRSAFAFGGFQLCMFHYSTAQSGNNMRSRVFYYNKAWESGANSNKVPFTDHPTLFADKTGGEWKDGMMTMIIDRTVTEGADYRVAQFNGSVAGATFTLDNGTGVADGKADHQFFTQEMNPAVDAFIGFPAQVYAVRAYNRVLTAAEKAQNHFADVAAYLGLNTWGVEFLEGAKAAAFYDLFVDDTFTSDAEVLQNKIFGALNALDVLAGYGETEGTVTEDDLIITTTYGAASMPLDSLSRLGFTVEMGVVLAPVTSEDMTVSDVTVVRGADAYTAGLETALVLVNYSSDAESKYVTGENMFSPRGIMFQMAVSYKDVVVANGLEAMVGAPLVFRGFVAITDAEGNTSIVYNDDNTSKSFYEFADYYVNEFEGDKFLMHDYNTNATLIEILGGAENVDREIDLGVTDADQVQTNNKNEAMGDIPESGITGAENIKQDAEDDVVSEQVNKIRPTATSNASYSFVSTVDGKVRLVIEYVAKAYTLGDRAISIKVDGYETIEVILSDAVTGINTSRDNHGFYVVEFEVAAGTHNIVIGAVEGTRAAEIFSIAVDAE